MIFQVVFPLALLSIFSVQIVGEWLAIQIRDARCAYDDNFRRVELIYPKYIR